MRRPAGSQRPFRGLFGASAAATQTQSLDLTLTVVEAYDDNLLAETGGVTFGRRLSVGSTRCSAGRWRLRVAGGSVRSSARRAGPPFATTTTAESVDASAQRASDSRPSSRADDAVREPDVAYLPSYLYGLVSECGASGRLAMRIPVGAGLRGQRLGRPMPIGTIGVDQPRSDPAWDADRARVDYQFTDFLQEQSKAGAT